MKQMKEYHQLKRSIRKKGRKLKVVKRKSSGNKRRRHLCCWNN
jgi:hypothetical protein